MVKYTVYVRFEQEYEIEADNEKEAIEKGSYLAHDTPPSVFMHDASEEVEAIPIEE
jgi:hypothetical protein